MLSQNQIDTLFKFIIHQGVEYYDLQIELVDHLATDIEEKIEQNSALTPYEALQEAYAEFGENGFEHLVDEKRESLKKQNAEIYNSILTQYFKLPRILTILMVVFATYSTSISLTHRLRGWAFCWIAAIFFIVQLAIFYYVWRGRKRKLLLVQNFNAHRLISLVVPFLFFLHQTPSMPSNLFFTALVTFMSIGLLATSQLNKQLREKAEQLYPEAFVKA